MAEKCSVFLKRVNKWNKLADSHREKQLINPFSDWEGATHRQKLSKDDANYGRPVEGSKTEFRGKLAGELSSREVVELCYVINDLGTRHPDGSVEITFGQLFEAYIEISSKLVGTLLRARKYKYVDFTGEMLYQGRDEGNIITLKTLPERE